MLGISYNSDFDVYLTRKNTEYTIDAVDAADTLDVDYASSSEVNNAISDAETTDEDIVKVIEDTLEIQDMEIKGEFTFDSSGALKIIETDASNYLLISPTGIACYDDGTPIFALSDTGLTLQNGSILAGTVTGALLRTGTSGRRIVITNDQYIRWYDGNDVESYISTDTSGNMIIDADNSIKIQSNGTGDYVQLEGDDLFFDSNSSYFTNSGDWLINKCDSFIVNFNSDNNGAGFYVNEDGDLAMSIDSGKNVWMEDNCSAKSFTDRTPYYDGKSALADVKQIKGKRGKDGKMGVDHDVLPDFIKKEVKHRNGKGEEFVQAERDLGNTISLLLEAVKELDARLDIIENTNKKNKK